MPLSEAAKNAMLDHLGSVALRASLHSADPGSGGANELSGGVPAYARKPITWAPASGSSKDSAAAVDFDVPAGAAVRHFGLWSVDGLTFYGSGALTEELFAGQGIYTLTAADLGLI